MYALKRYKDSKLLILLDIGILAVAPFLGGVTRYIDYSRGYVIVERFTTAFYLANLVYFALLFIGGQHEKQKDYRNTAGLISLAVTVGIGFVLSTFVFYAFRDVKGVHAALRASRGAIGFNAVWVFILCYAVRWLYSSETAGKIFYRAAILGLSESEKFIKDYLKRHPEHGIQIVGHVFVKNGGPGDPSTDEYGIKPIGFVEEIETAVEEHNINLIIVADEQRSRKTSEKLLNLGMMNIDIVDMPTFYEHVTGRIPFDYINHDWFLTQLMQADKLYVRNFKPFLDRFFAVAGLVLSLPVTIPVALYIKLRSEGPLLYTQTRLGLHGEEFAIFKFRTMRVGAEEDGAQQTSDKDDRIIPLGRLIRKFRIDEIPQFWNVLKGEMSVVGPRPERPEFIEQYEKEMPFYRERLFVRPGITGWAQIHAGYTASSEETREKLLYDLYYIKNVSFMTDLAILLRTIRIVLFGKGAK